uniref:Vacuolar protein sorting-associated protein 72 homolog n=1 Tax=Globodera pallida TaxID=36090 RepID=A0A183CBC9_GLOPA
MTEESNSGSPLPSTSDPGSAAKRARMVSNLEMEEDEEMTTTDEEREAAKANPVTGKTRAVFEEDDDVEEEEEEAPLPEALALTRARRPNAGRKMAELMAQQNDKDDDFYGTAYGGFGEGEQDADFESPPHSSDEEEAEVDSDFDRDEDEGDDPAPVEEDPEQIERRRKRLNQKRLLEHNKNWAIARINRMAVPENACDPKTQRQRLEEAKQTAVMNIASLKRFEDMELERKRRHQKPVQRRALEGPRARELWTSDGLHCITFLPEPPPAEQCFPKPKRREFRVCAISGQPARYIDPVTRLPYADMDAFRVLREKYRQFLETDRGGRKQQQQR